MKELKFRAYDGKRMAYFDIDGLLDLCSLDYYVGNLNPRKGGGMPSLLVDECEPLMQYTGLKDKNSKEIYEGDIYKLYQFCGQDFDGDDKYLVKKYVVKYAKGVCSIGFNFLSHHSNIEVIGNIYENPELLNK